MRQASLIATHKVRESAGRQLFRLQRKKCGQRNIESSFMAFYRDVSGFSRPVTAMTCVSEKVEQIAQTMKSKKMKSTVGGSVNYIYLSNKGNNGKQE